MAAARNDESGPRHHTEPAGPRVSTDHDHHAGHTTTAPSRALSQPHHAHYRSGTGASMRTYVRFPGLCPHVVVTTEVR
jgi:hypothetical protein